MSSEVEGFPKALLEAAACGCACVSTNVGDCDYFQGYWIYFKTNKYDLANKILRLMNSSTLGMSNSLKQVNKSSLFSWDEYIICTKNI